jgi:hypothetical protein
MISHRALTSISQNVKVEYADGLKDRDWIGKMTPYVIVTVGQNKQKGRVVHHGGTKPVFDQDFRFCVINENEVHIAVKEHEAISMDENIGEGSVSLHIVRSTLKQEVEVPMLYKGTHQRGFVKIALTFTPNGAMPDQPRMAPQSYGYPPQQPGYPPQQACPPPPQPYGYPPQQSYGYPPQQEYRPQQAYPPSQPYGYPPQPGYGYPPPRQEVIIQQQPAYYPPPRREVIIQQQPAYYPPPREEIIIEQGGGMFGGRREEIIIQQQPAYYPPPREEIIIEQGGGMFGGRRREEVFIQQQW